jgi:2-polyprenyl-3-methyl-5-hydroxy-6-metoxy-1,4-benzoquinol methylase
LPTDSVPEYYDRVGAAYDTLRGKRRYLQRVGQRELEFVLRNVPEKSNILEIGPGTGFFTRHLVEVANDVVALDISQVMLDVLRERIPAKNLTLHQMGVEDLPSLSRYGQFDSVVCMRVLPHVRNVVGALQIIQGALRPGGNALLDLWNAHSFVRLARRVVGSAQHVFTQYYRYERMTDMVEQAGLRVAECWGWGYPGLGLGLGDTIGFVVARKYAHAILFNCVKA